MQRLHDHISTGDRDAFDAVIHDRKENAQVYKKIKGKGVVWEDLKDEVVYRLAVPGQAEQCVLKLFPPDEFPFHEICGNIIATKLAESAGPFFVKCFDVGQFTDPNDNRYFLLMEYFEEDTDSVDIDEPIHMYNLFYQVNYVAHHLSLASSFELQHFDLRYDNIRIKTLPKQRDFFQNGVKTTFAIKVGDWGQCEFNWGQGDAMQRISNPDVPRESEYAAKWGMYPVNYSNYDFQYFLSTLTPVLDNLHGLSFYYIYTMVMDYLQPVSFTDAQDRPVVITEKTAKMVLSFMKTQVLPSVELLSDDEEGDKGKENEKAQ